MQYCEKIGHLVTSIYLLNIELLLGKHFLYSHWVLFRISDPSDLPHTTLSTNEDCGEKQILPATVSEKNLSSVTGSVSKSTLTEGAQKGKKLLGKSFQIAL